MEDTLPCSNDSNKDSQQTQEVTVNSAESAETNVIHKAKIRKQPTLVDCLERGLIFSIIVLPKKAMF